MPYNSYLVYDVDRFRHSELGGPKIYARCEAMSHGDRCEYRVHPGSGHAAQSGGHQWHEDPVGVCSKCGDPKYPLGIDVSDGEYEPPSVACPYCARQVRRLPGDSPVYECRRHGRMLFGDTRGSFFRSGCCDGGLVVRARAR